MLSQYLHTFILVLVINFNHAESKIDACQKDSISEECHAKKKTIQSELKENIIKLKAACGDVCNRDIPGTPSKFYDFIKKDFNCPELFSNEIFDRKSEEDDVFERIPRFLKDDFTYNGKVALEKWILNDADGATHNLEWTDDMLHLLTKKFKIGVQERNYGKDTVYSLETMMKLTMDLEGKHVLVIGSQYPWIETMVLFMGAKHVTTLEYETIKSHWSNITTLTPKEFNQQYLDGTLPQFDRVITFSSLEHSGLGRYGDALNPWGDVITMAKVWCAMKPGGLALVGVPTAPRDILVFNAHRIYGPVQFAQLFANFEQLHSNCDLNHFVDLKDHYHNYQPFYVLKKPEN